MPLGSQCGPQNLDAYRPYDWHYARWLCPCSTRALLELNHPSAAVCAAVLAAITWICALIVEQLLIVNRPPGESARWLLDWSRVPKRGAFAMLERGLLGRLMRRGCAGVPRVGEGDNAPLRGRRAPLDASTS